jgi:hypothetical protein
MVSTRSKIHCFRYSRREIANTIVWMVLFNLFSYCVIARLLRYTFFNKFFFAKNKNDIGINRRKWTAAGAFVLPAIQLIFRRMLNFYNALSGIRTRFNSQGGLSIFLKILLNQLH